MDGVLATLEEFHANAACVFDQVEAACGQLEARLEALEGRLSYSAARLEASRGSTRALVVQSARTLDAVRIADSAKRMVDSDILASLSTAAHLPEDIDTVKGVPMLNTAAEDLARVVRCVGTSENAGASAAANRRGEGAENLLAARGRLGSVSELFLFNSDEQPYKRYKHVDNLLAPHDQEPPPSQRVPLNSIGVPTPALDLQGEDADPLLVDICFRPRPAAEVIFDLPDVLPDLGGPVADLVWRQQDQAAHETERPTWDKPMGAPRPSRRASNTGSVASRTSRAPSIVSGFGPASQPSTIGPGGTTAVSGPAVRPLYSPAPQEVKASLPAPSPPPPPPVPAKNAKVPPKAPPAKVPHKETAKGAAPPPKPPTGNGMAGGDTERRPPPPPPQAKDPKAKVKGKGKGKGGPAPPPKGPAKMPAAKPPGGGGGVSKDAMFADIKRGGMAKLRKVAPPKERTGAKVGKVIS